MAYELLKQEMYNNMNGINAKASDYLTADNQVLNLRNLAFERPGAWTTRPGHTGFQTLANGTFAPNSIFHYYFDSYTNYPHPGGDSAFAVQGTSQYIYDSGTTMYKLSPTLLPFASGMGPGASGVGAIDFQVFNNILYFANGYSFQKYNGLSLSLKYSVPSVGIDEAGNVNSSLVPLQNLTTYFNTSLFESNFGVTTQIGRTMVAGVYNFFVGAARLSKGADFQVDPAWGFPGSFVNNPQLLDKYEVAPPIGLTFTASVSTTIPGVFLMDIGPTLPFTGSLFSSYGVTGAVAGSNPGFMFYAQHPGELNPILSEPITVFQTLSAGSTHWFIKYPSQALLGSPPAYRMDFFPTNIFFTLTPRYLETYNNMMFMSGFSTSPSSVWHTAVDDADTVEDDFNFEVRTQGNGEFITGMKVFQGSLMITKQNSLHQLTGFTPDDLSLQDVSLEYGNLSNLAMVTFENRFWFMDSKGIVEYNGNNCSIVSEKIAIYLNRCDKSTARMYHMKKYNQVWTAVKDNTTNKYKLFVYDYLIDGFTIYDDFDITGGSNLFPNGREEKELHFYGKNQSLISKFHSFNSSLFSDDSFGITQIFQTKFHKRLGDSTQELFRRFYMNNSVEGSTLGFTLNFIPNYGTSVVLTRTMGLTMFQSRIDFGIPAKSLSVEAITKSTTPIKINGYTVESRYLRGV